MLQRQMGRGKRLSSVERRSGIVLQADAEADTAAAGQEHGQTGTGTTAPTHARRGS